MDLAQAIPAWHDFYLAAAGAAAVLLGLVFVGMSLHYDLQRLDHRLVALATESAVPFFYAVLTSLVMLCPIAEPWLPTIALLVIAFLAAMNSGLPMFGGWYRQARQPRPNHRFDRLHYVLPWLAALSLFPAALAILVDPVPGLYAVALVVVVLVALGMQNAWDVLLRRDLRDRTTDGIADDPG